MLVHFFVWKPWVTIFHSSITTVFSPFAYNCRLKKPPYIYKNPFSFSHSTSADAQSCQSGQQKHFLIVLCQRIHTGHRGVQNIPLCSFVANSCRIFPRNACVAPEFQAAARSLLTHPNIDTNKAHTTDCRPQCDKRWKTHKHTRRWPTWLLFSIFPGSWLIDPRTSGRKKRYILKNRRQGTTNFSSILLCEPKIPPGSISSPPSSIHTTGKEFLFFSSSLMWLRHWELSARDLTRCFIAVRQTDIATYFPLMSSKWAMQETGLKQGVRLGPQSESVA